MNQKAGENMIGLNPDSVYPNPAIKQVCFIKNIITRPNIMVGDDTYYDNKITP